MKKLISLSLFVILPIVLFAHQDKYYKYEYNNVTVRFKTGFKFEEIENAKIIGQYVDYYLQSIDYKKPVFLNFIHNYVRDTKNEYFVNYGKGELELTGINTFTTEDSTYSKYFEHTIPSIDKKHKLNLHQFGYRFSVRKSLELIHYAIKNSEELIANTVIDSLKIDSSKQYYKSESLSQELITQQFIKANSKISSILNRKVYKDKDSTNIKNTIHYSYYSQNNKYVIFSTINNQELIIDTVNQIYHVPKFYNPYQGSVFFLEKNSFRFYQPKDYSSKSFIKSKIHKVPIDISDFVIGISFTYFCNDIFLFHYINSFSHFNLEPFIYAADSDILITDFKDYLEKHKK